LLPVTFGFIGYKLFYAYDFDQLVSDYRQQFEPEYLWLIIAFALMPVNWLIEISKWKLQLNKYEHTTMLDAARGVLSGVSLSILTPNQIGDFAGRLLQLRELNKMKGVVVAVIGNTAQMMMTVAAGLPALYALLFSKSRDMSFALIGFAVTLGFFLLLYLRIGSIDRLFSSARIKKYSVVFTDYTRRELTALFLFSLLRYMVFAVQYFVLIYFYNIQIDSAAIWMCIAATLFAQAFVPSFLLLELGLRGASALWFFGIFADASQTPGILLSAYTLWMINLMIPAIAGLFLLMRLKL
jgi:hypothetical protein